MRVVWLSLTFFARCSAGPSTNNDLSVLFVCLVLWAISPARRRERKRKKREWNEMMQEEGVLIAPWFSPWNGRLLFYRRPPNCLRCWPTHETFT
jgi:hypothetical protein